MFLIYRFFSRKRDATSGDRSKIGKSRTPEPDKSSRLDTFTPQARSVGLSNTMLARNPTIKMSQV